MARRDPITWRNVEAPTMGHAAYPLMLSQNSMNTAFDGLQDILTQRHQIQSQNDVAIRNNNTQAFLDQIAKYRTPEELQAAQASGEIDRLREAYGNQIDPSSVRGAFETRLQSLMQNTRTQNEFADHVQDREDLPVIQQALAAAQRGDINTARTLLDMGDPRLRADAEKAITQAMRDADKHRWAGQTHASTQATQGLNQTRTQQQIDEQARKVQEEQRMQDALATLSTHARETVDPAARLRQELAAVNEQFGVHPDADGNLDTSSITPANLQEYNVARAEAAERAGPIERLSDTERAERGLALLRSQGYGEHEIAALRKNFVADIYSTAPLDPIGQDAINLAQQRQREAAHRAFFEQDSVASGGSTNAERNLDEVNKFIKDTVPDSEMAEKIRQVVGKVSREKFLIKDNNGVEHEVSAPLYVVTSAIQESSNGLAFNNRHKNVEKLIRERMKDPAVAEEILKRLGYELRPLK